MIYKKQYSKHKIVIRRYLDNSSYVLTPFCAKCKFIRRCVNIKMLNIRNNYVEVNLMHNCICLCYDVVIKYTNEYTRIKYYMYDYKKSNLCI